MFSIWMSRWSVGIIVTTQLLHLTFNRLIVAVFERAGRLYTTNNYMNVTAWSLCWRHAQGGQTERYSYTPRIYLIMMYIFEFAICFFFFFLNVFFLLAVASLNIPTTDAIKANKDIYLFNFVSVSCQKKQKTRWNSHFSCRDIIFNPYTYISLCNIAHYHRHHHLHQCWTEQTDGGGVFWSGHD